MITIEPCCSQRQMAELRRTIEHGGRTEFRGFGDLSLTELLPALLTRYDETEMLFAAPSIPDQATEVILKWLRKEWARVDGRGNFYCLTRLTIIADLSPSASPVASAWLAANPFPDRLALIDTSARQDLAIAPEDTALLLPDIAITGPLNLRYGQNFVCTATTVADEVKALWEKWQEAARPKPAKKTKAKKAEKEPEAESPAPGPVGCASGAVQEESAPAAQTPTE